MRNRFVCTVVVLYKGEPSIVVNGVGADERESLDNATAEEDWRDGIMQHEGWNAYDAGPTLDDMQRLDRYLQEDGVAPAWMEAHGFFVRVFYNELA